LKKKKNLINKKFSLLHSINFEEFQIWYLEDKNKTNILAIMKFFENPIPFQASNNGNML